MAIRTRDLTQQWRPGDAERMARLMNEAGRGWPGGTWDPQTPEEAARRVREQRLLAAFVADEGGLFAAYCNLYAKPNERNRAYVPFLTAHPDYQGKGYGKAVLLSVVERVYELGIPRVDLDTWPGNLKAVPLYKKSGFMWSPESRWGAYMQNFTPGARRHPAAQAYFSKHDWYQTMKRDVSLTPDEHKRGKVRVYSYEWEEGGDRLRMVYDRQSWGLVEIETDEFRVGCFLDDEKLVAGLPQGIRWEVVNFQKSPLDLALIASGDEGVRLDRKEILQVKDHAQLQGEFEIVPEIKEKEQEPRAPIIRTDLLVNGMPITLAAGFEVKQAVHFSLDSSGAGLRPNRPERTVIQVWSELDRPAEAKLRISASPGARLEETSASVQIPAKGSAEAPVTLTARESGPILLRVEPEVTVGERAVRPVAADLYAHALAPGELVGHVEKKWVVLESAALRVTVERRGGWTGVLDKVRNRWNVAAVSGPRLGPPFAWEEFFDTPCEAHLDHGDGHIAAVLRTQSIWRPGVWLERRIGLSNSPIIEVSDTLINASETRLEGRLGRGVQARTGQGMLAVPTAKGIVRTEQDTAGRSLPEHHMSEEGADWPEGWCAAEDRDGVTVGLIWNHAKRISWRGRWMEIECEIPAAEPGQSTSPDPIYLFVGDGDYATVRRWWQQLFGPRVDRQQRPPVTRQGLEFGLRPRPLVLHGRRTEANLVADSVGRLKFEGVLTVTAPKGIRVQPDRSKFAGVCGKRRSRKRVAVSRTAALDEGAYFIEASARIDRAVYQERQPLIVLGDPRARVSVGRTGEHGELFQIDNGLLSLTVAPDFCGSAISLQRGEEQLLRSAYPEARPLGWENPWFGGICAQLASVGREIFKERFKAREIERRGSQGIVWRGMRVMCSPKQERGRHEKLAVDYLLAPGSAILTLAIRTTRRTGTAGWMEGSFAIWPVLGGSYLDAVLASGSDPRTRRLRTEFGSDLSSPRWLMAENPKTGHAVMVAGPGREAYIGGMVLGADGYFLSGGREATQEAGETKESVFFVAFTEADKAPGLGEALSGLEALP